MCPLAHQAHDFPCFRHFQGTAELVYTESKLHHPIKMCGSHGLLVQCPSHAAIFLLYINIELYIHIFDYTYQWLRSLTGAGTPIVLEYTAQSCDKLGN